MHTKLATIALVCLVLTGPAWAGQGHGRGHGRGHASYDDDRRDDGDRRGCRLEARDVAVIREYYAPRYRRLPPGLQKKYARTGQLPPGWQKKLEPFPFELERRLTPLPRGYRRGVMDGYAVVYEPRTQVIIDVAVVFGGR